LDRISEAIVFGVLLPFLVVVQPQFLRSTWPRATAVGLLVWKLGMSILLVQDGMCVQFVTREPLYRDMGLVPHSWDVRADWRADTPRCSAIQTRGYARLDDFLVWFFNLPPRSDQLPAATDRPPEATLDATWSGYVLGDGAGPLRLELGPDMDSEIAIDGVAIDPAAARGGVTLTTGARELQIGSRLSADRWRMTALWNDRDLFSTSRALVSSPSALDLAIRPVGYLVTSAAAITLIGGWTISFIRRTASVALFGWALVTALRPSWPSNSAATRWRAGCRWLDAVSQKSRPPASFTAQRSARLRHATAARLQSSARVSARRWRFTRG
jgi:hypothetical protein